MQLGKNRWFTLCANCCQCKVRSTCKIDKRKSKPFLSRNELINPFFGQLSHPDELVRCSALSNLGEVCKNLKFSLGGIVQEVNNLNFDLNI